MTDSIASITVTLKLFAVYQEAIGVPEQSRQLPTGTTIAALLDQVLAEYPELAQWRSLTQFGVNLHFVAGDTVLQDGDEVVFIPPVSGG